MDVKGMGSWLLMRLNIWVIVDGDHNAVEKLVQEGFKPER